MQNEFNHHLFMRRIILTSLLLTCLIISGYSQENETSSKSWHPSQGALLDGRTILKANLPGLVLGNYNFSAERIIGKHFSLAGNIGYFPKGDFPYASKITELVKDDQGYLEMAQVNTLTSSVELRFYLSKKGFGRGFYISPYYRYGKAGFDNIQAEYVDDGEEEENEDYNYGYSKVKAIASDETYNITLNGNMTSHNFGLMMGYQWLVGKRRNVVIDWSVIGVHAGKMNTDVFGNISPELTAEEQQDARENIDEVFEERFDKFPFSLYEHTVNVTSGTTNINVKGPWAFIRGSLSVGIRF